VVEHPLDQQAPVLRVDQFPGSLVSVEDGAAEELEAVAWIVRLMAKEVIALPRTALSEVRKREKSRFGLVGHEKTPLLFARAPTNDQRPTTNHLPHQFVLVLDRSSALPVF
jgi:hypothetical protein